MSPKARVTGGETLDSPLRIEYYASDEEPTRRISFRQAFKHPTKLFRDRKPAKKEALPSSRAPSRADTTISLNAIALTSQKSSDSPLEAPIDDPAKRTMELSSKDCDDNTGHSNGSQKRKPSQDHVEGTERSTSKSRTEMDVESEAAQSTPTPAGKPDQISSANPLQTWFEANRENPYPTTEEKEWLATQSGRSLQQISSWFHHKRSRVKDLERADDAQTAVIQWMSSLNADGSSQSTVDAAGSPINAEPSQRWSQADVVLNLLEQNKSEIAKAAGNYLATQPGPIQTNDERSSSKQESAPGKRDSAMTTTTIAPSVFSRSSTWTDRTSLTAPSDLLTGEGPTKRRFRDSRDSSVFSRPLNSARSSLISHPAIPFRTRSLHFHANNDLAPESPPPVTRPRSVLQTNPMREILGGEQETEKTRPQSTADVDPDDVFTFEHPQKLPDGTDVIPNTVVPSISTKSSRGTLVDKENFDKETLNHLEGGNENNELERLAKSHPLCLPSSPTRLNTTSDQTTAMSLSPIDESQASHMPETPASPVIKLHSHRSKDTLGRPSFPTVGKVSNAVGPVAPRRTSSLRTRSKNSAALSTIVKQPSSTSLARPKTPTDTESILLQDSKIPDPKDPRNVSFAGVAARKIMPLLSSFERRSSLNFSRAVESHGSRVLEAPESETSLSVDDSDFDDASSGITDYSDETVKMESPSEGLGPVIQLVIANIRRDVVSRVIQELRGNTENGQGRNASTSAANSQRGGSSEAATPVSQPLGAGNKRTARDRDSLTPDDRDDEDPDKRRKLTNAPIHSSILRSRFACPFYKHNSENHQRWRSCKGPGWDEVRRVKEHVYRRHVLPIRCMRCYQTFKDEATLGRHAQQDVPCQRSSQLPEQVIEGCDKDQEKRLKCRKRKPGETEEDRWVEMYRVLFGNDCLVPAPYYDLDIQTPSMNPNNFPILEDSLRELPTRLAQDINRMLSRPLDEQQRQDLPRIIQNSLQEVMQPFLQMLFPPSPTNSQSRSGPPASDPGDSTYGSIDQETRLAFTPPCLSGQDQESRTTSGTVPEGMPMGEGTSSTFGYPVPMIMLNERPVHTSNGQNAPSSQAWSSVTPFTAATDLYATATSQRDPFSSYSTQSNVYSSAPANTMNPPVTGPPNDSFADLLYPEHSFLPDPPRVTSATSNRWSMPVDREASQILTPIWDEQFPNSWQVEASSTAMHYSQPMSNPPNLNMPLLPHINTSQPDLTQTFAANQFSAWIDGKFTSAEG